MDTATCTRLKVIELSDSDGEESGIDYCIVTDDEYENEITTLSDRSMAYRLAASTDLYAALESLVNRLEEELGNKLNTVELAPQRSALAKARGDHQP